MMPDTDPAETKKARHFYWRAFLQFESIASGSAP
jgi:hypothetical protein